MIERDRAGSDTLSTHALMRAGVSQLHRWGVLDAIRQAGTPPITQTRFVYGEEAVDVDIRPAHGVDALYAPRRTLLDTVLANAALNAGATLTFGTACRGLLFERGRVAGVHVTHADGRAEEIRASCVIGADGLRSFVARKLAAPVAHTGHSAAAIVYARFAGLAQGSYRWHYTPGAAGGIIPTNGDETCLFIAMPPEDFVRGGAPWTEARFRAFADSFLPELSQELRGAAMRSACQGFRGAAGFLRRATGPGWALVGDAGYFRDPLTANGISDALRDAEMLAQALIAGRPEDYEEMRDALSKPYLDVSDRIASFKWTLDEVKQLHRALNDASKPSQAWIAEQDRALAA